MRTAARLTVAAIAGCGALALASPAMAQTAPCPAGQIASGSAVVVCSPAPDVLPDQTGVLGNTVQPRTPAAGSTAGVAATTAGVAATTAVRSNRAAPSTLPFTGDEVLVLSVLGASALAVGAGLVVAGRRRTPEAA